MSTGVRYALYWAPEAQHPLWAAGCRWLGRDASQPAMQWPARNATDEPRRYGFHATLKAPMVLRDDAGPSAFLDAAARLASDVKRFDMPPLEVAWLQDFIALRPRDALDAAHPLRRLADRCVTELDVWRAPPDPAELARRMAGLGESQRRLLLRWGYPHVLAHWRFHVTLSNSLPPDDAALRDGIFRDAAAHFAPVLKLPLAAESLSVFIESAAGEPFVLAHRFPLAA